MTKSITPQEKTVLQEATDALYKSEIHGSGQPALHKLVKKIVLQTYRKGKTEGYVDGYKDGSGGIAADVIALKKQYETGRAEGKREIIKMIEKESEVRIKGKAFGITIAPQTWMLLKETL